MSANKRIISVRIVESDTFSEMSVGAQLLYFHLIMNADNEGFVGNISALFKVYGIRRTCLEELIENEYIIVFKFERVILITHWLFHNPSKFLYNSELNYPLLAERVFITADTKYTLKKCCGIVKLSDFGAARRNLGSPSVKETVRLLSSVGVDEISQQIRKDKRKDVDIDADIYVETERGKTTHRVSAATEFDNPKRSDDGGKGSMCMIYTALKEGNRVNISASVRDATSLEIEACDREPEENELCAFGTEDVKNVKLTMKQASKLYAALGVSGFNRYIDRLSSFITEKGADNLKNHYGLIMKWAREDGVINAQH